MVDLITLKNKYDEFLDLSYVKSLNDPEEEPYKTKYEARKLLEALITDLDKNDFQETNTNEFSKSTEVTNLVDIYSRELGKLDSICHRSFLTSSKFFFISKFLELNLAKNLIETEEIEQGEKLVTKIIHQLDVLKTDDNEYNPLIFNLKLNCFNEIIYIWSNRTNYKECLSLVHSIEEMYTIFKDNSKKAVEQSNASFTMPYLPYELIYLDVNISQTKREYNFESLYTHSLYFFAQIYGKLDDKHTAASYVQLTLQRLLDSYNNALDQVPESNDKKVDPFGEKVSFDPLEWATHTAAMSQYYLCEEDFATSRYVIFNESFKISNCIIFKVFV
jgi:hypothetical protein